MSSRRINALCAAGLLASALLLSACASNGAMKLGRKAEEADDYDRAVAEYTKAVREKPGDNEAQFALRRMKLRASQEHFTKGRRLAGTGKPEEALVELQLAAELNPGNADIDNLLRQTRAALRAKISVTREGKTRLETLIDQSKDLQPPGLDLPTGVKLADSLVFRNASARDIFTAIGHFANLSVVFDPQFRDSNLSIDLRDTMLEDALQSVTSSTRTFYRVTAPHTVTIVPDTAAKRREYEEEIIRTFYLSNADVKETLDVLRLVVDNRRLSPVLGINAIAIKDTPEKIAAAAKVISAIDKARAEVVIDVELVEVDRSALKEFGLEIASPDASNGGISGSANVNRDNFTLRDLKNLSSADVFLTGVPSLYYRLLKNDVHTRMLANPQLRTSEGITAQARFGDRVPVPSVTFAPIASGGVNQQPITSFTYENIGVNIDITPRLHHNDDVSLAVKVEVSSVSGTGYNDLPTFGNRSISTTIRLKDGETNLLAGLIRDDERKSLSGLPGLSDVPLIGKLFANNSRETKQTDIILMLTPRIIRVLDLNETDLRPFRVGRDVGGAVLDLPFQPTPPPGQVVPPREQPVPQQQPGEPGQEPVQLPPIQGQPGSVNPVQPTPNPAQPVPPPTRPPGSGPPD